MAKHYNLARGRVGPSEASPPPPAPEPRTQEAKKPGRNRVNYPLVYVLRVETLRTLMKKLCMKNKSHAKPSVLINVQRKIILK